MQCFECKKTFPISKELKSGYIERTSAKGRLWFYENKDSVEPKEVSCPNCQASNPRWYEGEEGKEANDLPPNISIGGNVSGTNIVIGDNNKV